MNQKQLSTAVLFIIFNRPDTTQEVFHQIRKAKPTQLFIAADGPRNNHPTDQEKCAQAKEIVSKIDWPCDVKTLFHKENLGCGLAPSKAINWFFDHVEQGIILEDDCVPTQSFFYFCQKILSYYKHDTRIAHIAGTSFCKDVCNSMTSSYYFSRIPQIWGWATWKRAWKNYDFMMSSFPEFKENNIIKNIFHEEILQEIFFLISQNTYNHVQNETNQTLWDFQWLYAILTQNGLCITPTKNLIRNIGFREDATHTKCLDPLRSNIPVEEMDVTNLIHPTFTTVNKDDELWVLKNDFQIKIPSGILWETKKLLKKNFSPLKKWYSTCKKAVSR